MIKIGKEPTKIISNSLMFIDIARFMTSSISNLIYNHVAEIHKIKRKHEHDYKKCETCEKTDKDWIHKSLEYISVKYDLTEYRCFCCNKNYQKRFDEIWKK